MRFALTAEAAAVLASPDHPAFGMGMFHRLPQTMQTLERMPESFRSGLGHDYDSHGPEGAVGLERSFEPWNRTFLLPVVLPALEGVVDKLTEGATVVDIGCGAGGAVLLMAGAFPASRLQRLRHLAVRADTGGGAARRGRGFPTARSTIRGSTRCRTTSSVDLVTTFDCLHDMTDPQGMMVAIRRAIADDGTWLLVDIKARDTFAENVEKNPMAPLMYGISVLSCMSSALSEPGGAGLGTLGLSASKAEAMARGGRLHAVPQARRSTIP